MENLSNVRFGPLPPDSPYCQPFRFHYLQNGKEKSWDLLKVHDSVSIVIFNSTRNKLVFVKQFRPAVYYGIISAKGISHSCEIDTAKYPAKLGITLELCAGIIDKKDKSIDEIAQEEILEEVGYEVSTERLEEVLTYRSGVGTTGALQKLFYCEVTDDDKVTTGGGVDDEIIEVVEYSIDEVKELIAQGNTVASPPSFLFGVFWFLSSKAHKFLK